MLVLELNQLMPYPLDMHLLLASWCTCVMPGNVGLGSVFEVFTYIFPAFGDSLSLHGLLWDSLFGTVILSSLNPTPWYIFVGPNDDLIAKIQTLSEGFKHVAISHCCRDFT